MSSGSSKNITDISSTLTKNNDEGDKSFTGDLSQRWEDDYHDVSFQDQEGTNTEDLVRVSSSEKVVMEKMKWKREIVRKVDIAYTYV